jgi:hypothetical protein
MRRGDAKPRRAARLKTVAGRTKSARALPARVPRGAPYPTGAKAQLSLRLRLELFLFGAGAGADLGLELLELVVDLRLRGELLELTVELCLV